MKWWQNGQFRTNVPPILPKRDGGARLMRTPSTGTEHNIAPAGRTVCVRPATWTGDGQLTASNARRSSGRLSHISRLSSLERGRQ